MMHFLHSEVLFDDMAYFLMLWRTCSHNEVLFDVMEYFMAYLFILWRTFLMLWRTF